MIGFAYAISNNRKAINWRPIIVEISCMKGLLLQVFHEMKGNNHF